MGWGQSLQRIMKQTNDAPNTDPRRILIVDDDEEYASLLHLYLKRVPGCEVTRATGGAQALQFLERQTFDLLITDYEMPGPALPVPSAVEGSWAKGMDGLALAARVRQLYPLTAIVMLTGHGGNGLREQAARLSIRRVLSKLVSPAELRAVVVEELELG